jgi:hypothetical protein
VSALDLDLALWRGRVTPGDVVEAQSPAKLGEGVWGAREEERVVVDTEGQREAMSAESCGKEVEVGGKIFPLIEARAGEQAPVNINKCRHLCNA